MAPRLELHALLKLTAEIDNVYFQPPSNVEMKYPCIVYRRDKVDTLFAENRPYKHDVRYQLTVIDRDPDSLIPVKIRSLPKCVHDRFYTADGLNHDVFNIFF